MCLDCLIHGHQYKIIDTIKIYENSDSAMPYSKDVRNAARLKRKRLRL